MTRFSRHLALAAWAILGLAGCGGDTPNEPSPNPGAQTPTVSAVSPAAGTTLGGTTVTVTGTNFAAGATVTIGGTAATDVAVQGATSLTARTPQHASGPGDVVVTVAGRSGTLRNGFMFEAPAASTNQPPSIAGITSRSTRRQGAQRLRRPRRHAHRHRHGLRRRDAGRSAALRVDRGRRRLLRHRPRGHVARARAGHHPGRGAPEPRRRRDLPDRERPGPAGHGGTPRAGRVHGAAPRIGQGSARHGGRVPGRLLAAAPLARAGRPQLHRHVPRQGVRARGRPAQPAGVHDHELQRRAEPAGRGRLRHRTAAIATASATPAPTSRSAGNRRASRMAGASSRSGPTR